MDQIFRPQISQNNAIEEFQLTPDELCKGVKDNILHPEIREAGLGSYMLYSRKELEQFDATRPFDASRLKKQKESKAKMVRKKLKKIQKKLSNPPANQSAKCKDKLTALVGDLERTIKVFEE